ncbi:MAG: AAA family ATPase [Desulfurococcaceae archaeon]|nr:AAA family ATPase [Desulfurococcaceae archaeon]
MQRDYSKLVELMKKFKEELAKPFIGREEEALVLTLAIMTAEHAILVGEPGTAKSAMARRAADLVKARFFKYLLTRYTDPDELFGPLDIAALREGKYVRISVNRLPEAEIVFLDEIFNASSAILNTLLTLMNERVIYDGYREVQVPLWTLISASNTVPEEPEYRALYDRFLLRHFVKPVSEDKWGELLDAAWRIEKEGYRAVEPLLSMRELREIYDVIFNVDLSSIKDKLVKLYAAIEDQGVHISDRRKGKALKVIAAHSLLHGRSKAVEEDLVVLKYVAPQTAEEAEKTYIVLLEEVSLKERVLEEIREVETNIREVKALLVRRQDIDPRLIEYLRGLERAREKLKKILNTSVEDSVKRRALEVLVELEETIESVKRRLVL